MNDHPTPLGGTSCARFEPLRELFAAKLESGEDLVIGIPITWGVGYGLAREGRVCSWGDAGGSSVIIDVDRRMTFAYVMNKMALGGGTIAAALAERVADIVNR